MCEIDFFKRVAFDHNVDTLLVGIVKQIRLKMKKQRMNIYAR